MSRIVRLLALLAVASAVQAQGPSAGWRTIATPHFRVHYPAGYEQWASRAASRVESIRAAVVKEVGFDPPQTIDVIVSNPVASANGLAWPILDAPRIVFYTEPPGPDEQIGAYSDWIDLLAVHEITHIMHMLRPSRNPLQRAMERFVLPLDPITLDAPRWVLEGYATVVEGRLTGAGRPPSTMRAVVLRKWAASGRLPSYAQLNSDTRFLGMSMAYLAGSAYLEWLEARTGEGSLRRLWARMTARQRRSFAAAFAGVFGDSPERLYDRFTAELTASALAVNRAAPLREGDLWQETSRNSGDPVVSPDGSQIAVVLRTRNKPSRIVIWSTGSAEEERKKLEERIARILKRDPEDVPPVLAKPLPRKIMHSFTPADGGDVSAPRWTGDGKSILFSHRQPDGEGFLHHDLFLWTPSTGESRRVTRLADVFDADPLPDGRSAVAVRTRNGLSQLVNVDLSSGAVTPRNEPSLETVYSHPRAHGSQIVFVSHRNGVWTLSAGDRVVVSSASVATPEWDGDTIIATVLHGGFAELERIELTGEHHPITRSSGGAFQPAPAPDGRVFFMGLEPDGFVLRVMEPRLPPGPQPAEAGAPWDASLVPALPPVIPAPPAFASEALSPSRPYGIGRQEITWLVGEQLATKQHATEVGVRIGDVIGRLDTLALGSIGSENAQRGAAIVSTWRGWPVVLSGNLFTADDRLVKRNGLEVRGSWRTQRPLGSFSIAAGGLTGRPLDIGFLQAAGARRQIFPSWRADEELLLWGERGSLAHYRGVVSASVKGGAFRIAGRYQHDESRGSSGVDVGGLQSSILPHSAIPNRIFDPALPIGTLSGRHYDGARIEATLPILPATAFYQHHRTESGSVALAGLELAFASGSVPLLRLPALDMTAGVARILDEPLRNRTEWWLAMRWRP
ncbi:MAG TPA: hypothetical protein VLV78_01145 [Thermoanaerobaculia bacterium]|nr:hypothetical protein [Thermoanaerobaculia bacterium]